MIFVSFGNVSFMHGGNTAPYSPVTLGQHSHRVKENYRIAAMTTEMQSGISGRKIWIRQMLSDVAYFEHDIAQNKHHHPDSDKNTVRGDIRSL